jgi:hypothetical protein
MVSEKSPGTCRSRPATLAFSARTDASTAVIPRAGAAAIRRVTTRRPIPRGVDAVALTHLDTAARHPELQICRAYQAPGHALTRLQPGPPRDLGYQEQLTQMLLAARPIYSPADGDWPDVVSQETGTPVVLRSHGPTAADKTASEALRTSRMAA